MTIPFGSPTTKLLLIGERPDAQESLEEALHAPGRTLVCAHSVSQALALLQANDFLLVLLDAARGIDALKTAREIRALERSRQTPLLLLVEGSLTRFPVAEALKLGAVECWGQPAPLPWLRAKVEGLIRLQESSSPARSANGQKPGESPAGAAVGDGKQLDAEETEQRLRLAIAAARMNVWDWILDDNRVVCSENAREIWGLTEGNIEEFYRAVHPDDMEAVIAAAQKSIEVGRYAATYRVHAPDGRIRWLSSRGEARYDAQGKAVRLIGVSTDITAQKQAEEALAAREREFRAIFEMATAGMARADAASGRFELVNQRFCEITGYSEQELIGMTSLDLTHPDDRENNRQVLQSVLQGRADTWDLEKRYVRKDGRSIWVLVSGRLIRDSDGKPAALLAFIFEVSERKHAEHLLHRYRLLSQHARDVVLFIRPNGIIVEANEAAVASYGYSRDELLGRSILDLRAPETRDEAIAQLIRANHEGIAFDTYHRRKDGSIFPVEVNSQGADIDGERLLLSVVRDASDRRKLEDELRRRMEDLSEASRRKDEFLAMLAHELRNPLAPIRNAVHVMNLIGIADSRLQQSRDMIERQVVHLTRLVDDLLDVSRIKRGKILLRTQQLDLVPLVRSAAEDHRNLLLDAGIELALDLPARPHRLQGDATRLAQIVGNLLNNACKFTDPGGTVTVKLTTSDDGRTARLSVRDTGIGMDREMLARLFEPFSQAEQSLERTRGGLGLGLALVKGLVSLHGGTVSAVSGLGEGTEIIIELPLDVEPTRLPRPLPRTSRQSDSLHVLVVEDSDDAAESLRMLLELNGHRVTIASSGEDGVEMARALHPDVVLCDIGLPGQLDGHAVARALRDDPELSEIMLVALSGYGQDEDLRMARDAGFDHHLIKPADPDRIQQILSRRD
jgi:PAS domain S-box-containing protein